MLEALAVGNLELFNSFSNDVSLTSHLIGYGLIGQGINGYYFKIESIKEHMISKLKFKRPNLTSEEKRKEINERRDKLEPLLRKLIYTAFQFRFGTTAQSEIAGILTGQSLRRFNEEGLRASLQPRSITLNLSDLTKIILRKWSIFENMLNIKQSDFEFYMESIRLVRTEEAHSGEISDIEFSQARISFDIIESMLKNTGIFD